MCTAVVIFPATFFAAWERQLSQAPARYFDLIQTETSNLKLMPFASPLSELCPLEDDHRKNNRQGEAGSVDPHHPRVLQDFGAQWNIGNIAGECTLHSLN